MWEAILNWLFSVIAWFESLVGDWGLAIIIITLIFRVIIFPITLKQFKSTHMMNKLQPRIKELQERYAGDQQRLALEMQAVYREAHFNPLSGCLPVLLQMPIFIILFQVLRSLTDRVESGTVISFYGIVPDLSLTPIQAFQTQGLQFSIIYFVLVAIFASSMIVPLLIQKNTEKQTIIIMVVMAAFMAYVGCVSPAGVMLYWDVSSIIGVATQLIAKGYYKKQDAIEEALEVKAVKVDVERKVQKARPTKKKKKH